MNQDGCRLFLLKKNAEICKKMIQTLILKIWIEEIITSMYAKGAVNQLLTVRNWMIGYYIVEYEQHGQNRAEYGQHLLENVAEKINIKGIDRQMLNTCRLFYIKYPQICETASRKFETPPETLITRLSFSHIKEIMSIDDPFERFFYEYYIVA